jgi:hypothetical protein
MQPAAGQVVRYAVHLEVIVGGQPVTVPPGIGVDERTHLFAGPGSLVLEPHQEVVVAYREGSAGIPASHAFPPGV